MNAAAKRMLKYQISNVEKEAKQSFNGVRKQAAVAESTAAVRMRNPAVLREDLKKQGIAEPQQMAVTAASTMNKSVTTGSSQT